jgi:hypothetical protein
MPSPLSSVITPPVQLRTHDQLRPVRALPNIDDQIADGPMQTLPIIDDLRPVLPNMDDQLGQNVPPLSRSFQAPPAQTGVPGRPLGRAMPPPQYVPYLPQWDFTPRMPRGARGAVGALGAVGAGGDPSPYIVQPDDPPSFPYLGLRARDPRLLGNYQGSPENDPYREENDPRRPENDPHLAENYPRLEQKYPGIAQIYGVQ